MPELPEVQALAERLQRKLRGRVIRRARVFRPRTVAPDKPASFERRLRGVRVTSVERRAKTIDIAFADGRALLAHMRMTGHLFVTTAGAVPERGVSFYAELDDGCVLVFEDPRGLGTLRVLSRDAADQRLKALGPEPLSPSFSASALYERSRQRRTPLKLFLMDQRHVAGLGNIYATEALWRARLDPTRMAYSLTRAEAGRLYKGIVSVLKDAIAAARAKYRKPGSVREARDFHPHVYQRDGERCRRCRHTIRRITQGGRSTFYCPNCQK